MPSVFIGGGDRVCGRDTSDTSPRCRLLLFLQNFVQAVVAFELDS